MVVTKYYRFGHSTIRINTPKEMNMPENMKLFEVVAQEVEVLEVVRTYRIQFCENLVDFIKSYENDHPGRKQILRPNMIIRTEALEETRELRFEGMSQPYAFYIEETDSEVSTYVDPQVNDWLIVDTIFVSLLALEKLMIQENALILHSAYMCKDGEAVLFSAPSGTGKSTQADLWEKYRGTRTINGDKSLLIRESDGWCAYGWPICGSSEICHNESYPIKAIVMLRQEKENSVKPLGMDGAMKQLMSQITMNMWNSAFQIKAMDLIEQLIQEVPVYALGCNISEEAVRCLENVF